MKKIPSVEVSFCFYVQYITNTFSPELQISGDSDAPSHTNRGLGMKQLDYKVGPPLTIANLVYKWLNSMVYGRYNYS